MKKLTYLLVLFSFSVFSQNETKFSENQIIIKLKEGKINSNKIDLLRNKLGIPQLDNFTEKNKVSNIQQIGNFKVTNTFLLVFENSIDVLNSVKEIKYMDCIDYAEPNYTSSGGGFKISNTVANFPNDSNFNRQWGLFNNGTFSTNLGITTPSTVDADVDLELAWDIETGDPNLIIAVCDSGLRLNHPDIASRLWTNNAEVQNGIDDDGNGLIDDLKGWDWVNNDNNATDGHGHGSNVTGIIGCIANNNLMFTGANWNSKIMSLRVLDNNNAGFYSTMASSIYYAVDKGAKIINMSIVGNSPATILTDAISYANNNGVLLVFSIGNNNNNTILYPAGYSTQYSNVIAVGSTDPNDNRTTSFNGNANFGSSYGSHINVVAPGNYIFGLDYNSNTSPDYYFSGTSQSSPLVAGIASLLKSKKPSLTPSEIRTILQNTAQDRVGNLLEDTIGFDVYMGYGRVNAYNALQSPSLSINDNNIEVQEFQIVNPVKNNLLKILSKGQYQDTYTITVHDIQGKLLANYEQFLSLGDNTLEFNFSSGNYILTLKSEKYTKIFKVLK